jgi:hypothetical protein
MQVTSGKSLARSVQAREEGNSLYNMGKFLPALQKYCTAVAFAPANEVQLYYSTDNSRPCERKIEEERVERPMRKSKKY